MQKRRTISLATAASAALVLGLAGVTSAAAASGSGGTKIKTAPNLVPKFVEESASGTISSRAVTIPSWTSSFTDPTNSKRYNYTMVGTDPSKGDVTTTIPTMIVPISFTYSNGETLNGADHVADTIASPVFASADIGAAANATASAPPADVAPNPRVVNEPSDVTQVGDAINRAQFGKSASGWHVVLGQPSVAPVLKVAVPANQGAIYLASRTGSHIGLMSASWFSSMLHNYLTSHKVSPTVLPIFLVNNTFLYQGTLDNCCILGYHGATQSYNSNGKAQINTYMFGSYSDVGIFGANDGDTESFIGDIHGLSHEVSEWYDDPFVNNEVNPWLTPTAPQYGCTTDLETGDPVVGYGFKVTMPNGTTYHPEDEVHYSWFARQSPSIAAGGYYTYLNNFEGTAEGC